MVDCQFLSEKDKELVHEKSLVLLAQAGVVIDSEKVLSLMAGSGCTVDFENHLVKFPPEAVQRALETAPSQFTLGGLTADKDMYLGAGNSYVCTDGQGCFTMDLETGKHRDSVMGDLVDAARIVEELDYIRCFWPIVTASDVPKGSRTIRELVETWQVCTAHYQTDCYNETQARYFIRVLDTIFGREQVLERTPFSLVCCPITPLAFEGPMLEGTIAMGEINTPVVILPMPIAGTTSPMSLFGTLIQNNAEVLAGLAILQAANPGRKVIYGAAAGILDMKTSLCCLGTAEGGLVNAACTQMAKKYHLPSMACFGTDAHYPGVQSCIEKAANGVPVYMAGADLLCGVGLTDSAMCLYHEELVLDEDIYRICQRIAQGIRTGEEHSLTEEVLEIGPGGNFISELSTVEYLRNGEYYYPKTLPRNNYEAWHRASRQDPLEIARIRIQEILSKPAKQNYSSQIRQRLDVILKEADQAFA